MTTKQNHTRLFRIRFIHAVKQGHTAREIAVKLGIPISAVRDRASNYGMKLARAHLARAAQLGISEKDLEEIGGDDVADFGPEGVA